MNWYKSSSEISPIQGPMEIGKKPAGDSNQKKQEQSKKEDSPISYKDLQKKEDDKMTDEKFKEIIEKDKK